MMISPMHYSWRSDHIWDFNGGVWQLKHPIWPYATTMLNRESLLVSISRIMPIKAVFGLEVTRVVGNPYERALSIIMKMLMS